VAGGRLDALFGARWSRSSSLGDEWLYEFQSEPWSICFS
jgi:hypothetical protein